MLPTKTTPSLCSSVAVVVFLLSAFSASPVLGQATLENPAPNSFQSGIGVISGWACEAREIEIEFDNDSTNRWRAGTGTQRTDTHGVCGDTDNGFGLLFNWNHLGDGIHTVRAFADGIEFATVTVIVTTLGKEFLRDTNGEVQVSDFPTPGATRTLRWQQAQQNFVITNGSAGSGGGTSGSPPRILENPSPGSFQSGVGVISGWVCEASQIEIEFNNDAANRWTAGYGTQRTDTHGVCGDSDNGFGLLFNWNHLGNGIHTVRALADGVEFAHVTVTVNTLGEEFAHSLSHEVTVADFPHIGTDLILVWQEAQQNFVIAAALPTARLVTINPVVVLPDGVSIPNVAVRSLYAEDAEVLARPEPSLLLAEDADGIVLLGVANMNGGLLGEGPGDVAVSVDSTAVVLVALAAGYAVHAIDQIVVDEIRERHQYQALLTAIRTRLAADKNFLDHLQDYRNIVASIQEVASTIAPPRNIPSRSTAIQQQTNQVNSSDPASAELRSRLLVAHFAAAVAHTLLPMEAIQRALQVILSSPSYAPDYLSCVQARFEQRTTVGLPTPIPPRSIVALTPTDIPTILPTLMPGIAGALQDGVDAIECQSPPETFATPLPSHLHNTPWVLASGPVVCARAGPPCNSPQLTGRPLRPVTSAATRAMNPPSTAIPGGTGLAQPTSVSVSPDIIYEARIEMIEIAYYIEIEIEVIGGGTGSAADCRICVEGGGDYDFCVGGGALTDAACVPHLNTDLAATCHAQGKDYEWVLAGEPRGCTIFE